MYKILDLFGNEKIVLNSGLKKRKNLFTDYDSFTEKFELKKTTDDCYTPHNVYQLILNYVADIVDLKNVPIIRPFYPGGNFENIEYPENCIVVDNPPFSIISKIAKFYISNDIKFFLFAPHLTLFSSDIDCTHIVVGANIVYENGATVKTSFLTNLIQDVKIIGDADLYQKFEELRKENKVNLPIYVYPGNVITVSAISYMVEKGVSIKIDKKDAKHCRALDSQKSHKKAIFGSGFLISEKAAAEKVNCIVWELSKKELDIINSLG